MELQGVDYSYARPDPAILYAAGKRFACRYLSFNTTGKNLTKAEADKLHAAKIFTVSNWEWSKLDALKGYDIGRQYATEALKQHLACGGPPNAPIYFSVDIDTRTLSGSDIERIRQYFAGIRKELGVGRTGIYGGIHIVKLAAAERWASYFWQTYAWSGGMWFVGNHMRQYKNGVNIDGDVDLNISKKDYFGQWGVGADMALTDLDVDKILDDSVSSARTRSVRQVLDNTDLAIWFGGVSAGVAVPDGPWVRGGDTNRNSLITKLDYQTHLLEEILAALNAITLHGEVSVSGNLSVTGTV